MRETQKTGRKTAGRTKAPVLATLALLVWILASTPLFADVIYTVQDGDSAWGIAIHFGISLEELYLANGWASDENPVLHIGDELTIPSGRVQSDEGSASDETSSGAETTYIVQPGDTPTGIAQHFGIGTNSLLEFNGLTSSDVIRPGQMLSIPPTGQESGENAESDLNDTESVPNAPEPVRYRIQPEDTIWALARQFGINVQTLLAYNNLEEGALLHPGDEILIPVDVGSLSSRSSSWTTYSVHPGDTLSQIASDFGVSTAALAEANHISITSTLREGQQLSVPSYRPIGQPSDSLSTPPPATPSVTDLSGQIGSLPNITDLDKPNVNADDLEGWHSEIFDFTRIEGPEPSSSEPEPVSEGGLSVDGHFDDGTPYHLYTVRRGDTLGGVADSFGVTQSNLMDRNGLDFRSTLRIGRDLKIPMPRPSAPPRTSRPAGRGNVNWGAPHANIGDGSGTASGRSVVEEASKYLGTPYVYGGNSLTGGIDCSGFTSQIYRQFGISLNRSARDQANNGVEVAYSDLQPGDLVFFHTTRPGISHVGMYIGGGDFIHSSSHRGGVVISPLDSGYYNERFVIAKRVL